MDRSSSRLRPRAHALAHGAGYQARSRFLRRDCNKPDNLSRSRLKKVVDFTLARDIKITEVRTDWTVEERLNQATRNASGTVGAAVVTFEWKEGNPDDRVVDFVREKADPENHTFGLPLTEFKTREALRVTSAWTWVGGAVLTRPSASHQIRSRWKCATKTPASSARCTRR